MYVYIQLTSFDFPLYLASMSLGRFPPLGMGDVSLPSTTRVPNVKKLV